jgi:3-deoxy-D-manno-octulosonate 8-phosphate phosphatase (KDO 8-P phosphatase)
MAVIDISGYDPLLVERAATVRALVLDVDGVLTDGRLYFDNQGNELKAFSSRDGLGMRAVQSQGTLLALITGRQSEIVARRAANLGIEHIYQGRHDKLDAFNELLAATGLEERQVCWTAPGWP